MTDITPEKVASALAFDDGGFYSEDMDGWVTFKADAGTVHVKVASHDEDGEEVPENARHFTATVVEGTETPIVLERPDLTDLASYEGATYGDNDETGWQVVPYSTAAAWPCYVDDADSILYRLDGDPSNQAARHISFAEARRFAAALLAVTDAAEAAQAEKDGGAS